MMICEVSPPSQALQCCCLIKCGLSSGCRRTHTSMRAMASTTSSVIGRGGGTNACPYDGTPRRGR